MKRIPVNSSNLKSVGYDSCYQILEVEFNNLSIYQYQNVHPSTFQSLISASSKGTYFSAKIKDNSLYPCTKIK